MYRTSGENIGDTGIIQAYRAWQAQYDDSLDAGSEYVLPGLNFTRWVYLCLSRTLPCTHEFYSEQLFFISFARAWAQNIKPAAAVRLSVTTTVDAI
jgi:endothelin-converting enzyme